MYLLTDTSDGFGDYFKAVHAYTSLLDPKQRFGAVIEGALQVDCLTGSAIWRPGDFVGSRIITRNDAT